jgi:ATP-dependent DNA ligase
MKGNNSNIEREQAIIKLLQDAKEEEIKYIVRFIQGNLKIGAAEATMQQALVQAFLVNNYIDENKVTLKGKNFASIIPDFENKVHINLSY